jgi:hypothetical protein
VKKYLRSDETEPAYVRRVGPSKLDLYAEKLNAWLEIEVTKSRKQRRNLKQIYTQHCKDSTKKGEDQELTHTVSTFCSQRVWVKIGWKEWVRLQCNSTCCPQDVARILPRTLFTARIPIFFGFTPRCTMRYFHEKE